MQTLRCIRGSGTLKCYRLTREAGGAAFERLAVPHVPRLYCFRKGKLYGVSHGELSTESVEAWIRSIRSTMERIGESPEESEVYVEKGKVKYRGRTADEVEAARTAYAETRRVVAELGAISSADLSSLRKEDYARVEQVFDAATASLEVITDDTFEEKVLSVVGPVIVFIGAESVSTGHEMGVVLNRVAQTTSIRVYRMKAATCLQIYRRFAVNGAPWMYLFYRGRLMNLHRGAWLPQEIEGWVRKHAASSAYDGSRAGPVP